GTGTVRNFGDHRWKRRLSATSRSRSTKCRRKNDNRCRVYWRNRSETRAARSINRMDASRAVESTPEVLHSKQGPSRNHGRPDRPEKPVRSEARLESIAIAGET